MLSTASIADGKNTTFSIPDMHPSTFHHMMAPPSAPQWFTSQSRTATIPPGFTPALQHLLFINNSRLALVQHNSYSLWHPATATHSEQPVDDRPCQHAGCSHLCASRTHDASTAHAGTLRCPGSHAAETQRIDITPRTLNPTTGSTTTTPTTTTTTHSVYAYTNPTCSGFGHRS